MGVSPTEKNTAGGGPEVATLEDVPSSPAREGVVTPDKGAVNVLMVVSCIAFGSAAFLFGYDDKVISPVAATPFFVRHPCQHCRPWLRT